MKILIIKKILGAIFVVIILSILCFLLIHMLPGDPASMIAGTNATPEMVEAIRVRMGLHLPLHEQYLNWAKGILTGDWGKSLIDNREILPQILERLPRTLLLTISATIISLCISIPLSVTAASKHNSYTDLTITSAAIVLLSVPEFWFGMLLLILFAVELKVLPAGGFTAPSVDFWMFLKRMILPVMTTSICLAPGSLRLIRSSMLDVLGEDYIMLARVKGNPSFRVNYIHALRNSLIPVSTSISMTIASLMAGAIIIEKVFQYPGMGFLMFNAIEHRNYPMIQGTLLMFSLIIVVVNFFTDFIYLLIDPRIRLN
ncbi:MAG TPA: ABC transporter permease [Clostridiaceae bacterium]|nr:ABC transporter permease [Clostridiaceae bacterium]